jgi:predicted AlkP superfamily phosphohydrolase/phosphomutase
MKLKCRIFIVAVLLLAIAASPSGPFLNPAGLAGCSKRTDEAHTSKEPLALSGYLKDGPAAPVVFIGLDGVSWNVIDPMIERGELPTFRMLKERGAWGDLISTECYLSSSAWPAMMTGCKPEQTGVYCFAKLDSFEGELLAADSRDVMVPSVWDISSAAGLRTGVVNVPLTWPVRPVNGIMLSGFLTPGVVPIKRSPTVFLRCYRASKPEAARISGITSYSVPLKANKNVFRNKLTVYLLDTLHDKKHHYDTACLIINPVEDKRVVNSESQRVICRIDSLSPWVKLDYADGNGQEWGWARIKLRFDQPTNHLALDAYPVYFDLADTSVNFCYPKRLRGDLIRDLTRYFPYAGYLRSDILNFIEDKERYLDYFYRYEKWDFFLFEFQETDKMLHEDGDGPYTQELHRRLDGALGRFIDTLPENVTLFIASDHGFKPYRYKIGLNAWFEQLGLVVRDAQSRIDRKRSFLFHNEWNIYVNRPLLEREYERIPDFSVPQGADVYEAFLDYLINLGADFKTPGSGTPMPMRFSRYAEPNVGAAPDLLVQGGYGDYRALMVDNPNRSTDVFMELGGAGDAWYHRREGIFLAYGNNIEPGVHLDPKPITWVAPTMLYALGIPPAASFDGRVIEEIFDGGFRGKHPMAVYAYYADLQEIDRSISAEEREKLEEKLRSLGYME